MRFRDMLRKLLNAVVPPLPEDPPELEAERARTAEIVKTNHDLRSQIEAATTLREENGDPDPSPVTNGANGN